MRTIFKSAFVGTKLLLIVSLLAFANGVAYATLSERPEMKVSGQYDVKMVSSQALVTCWVSSENPIKAIRPLTDKEMSREYAWVNNEVNFAGQAFSVIYDSIPVGAVNISQVYADCDDDATTWQSSCAYLDFGENYECTYVQKAYLYWVSHAASTGYSYAAHNNVDTWLKSMPANSNDGLGSGDAYKTVKFKAPGDTKYTDVTATRTLEESSSDERKVCYADVTSLVQGKPGGNFWVANMHSGIAKGKGGATAGWTLVVVFTPPNCPTRTIRFWDGVENIDGGDNTEFQLDFATGEVPASSNSVSYLGISVLDGENLANYLIPKAKSPEFLEVYSKSASKTGSTYEINPFAPGQTLPNVGEPQDPHECFDKNNVSIGLGYDGFSCSRISSYDDEKGTNGNALARKPNQRNTLGYDAHHIKLPQGAVIADARSVFMKYYAGPQGGTSPFMAYMAIQTLQPDLRLDMEAVESNVATSGELTYELTVKNVGPIASTAGDYIVDTLDQALDFVAGSVEFLDKNGSAITTNFQINNPGADADEYLVFTLPSIGANETDSLTIRFKAKVKDLSYTNIWSYGCNTSIRNQATIYFKGDTGDYLSVGSNSSASCDGVGNYYSTPISDTGLEEQIARYHNIDVDLSEEVNAGTVYISAKLLSILADTLAAQNLPATDINEYAIYNLYEEEIPASAYFTDDESVQEYIAQADFGGGCIEQYNFTVSVVRVPKFDATNTKSLLDASSSTTVDGMYQFAFTNGAVPYKLELRAANGTLVYMAYSDGSIVIADALPAGTYTAYLTDANGLQSQKTIVVNSQGLDVNISDSETTICAGNTVNIISTPSDASLTFVWKSATKNASGVWNALTEISGATGSSLSVTPSETTKYVIYACNSASQASDTIVVNVNPIPVVSLDPSEKTVSISVDPTATFTANVSVGTASTYTWTAYNNTSWVSIPSGSLLGTHTLSSDGSTLVVSGIKAASPNLEMDGYQYSVVVSDAIGCTSVADTSLLNVVEGPALNLLTEAWTSCPGSIDGAFDFEISSGEPNVTYTMNLYAEDIAVGGSATTSVISTKSYLFDESNPEVVVPWLVNGLSAGDYTVIMTPSTAGFKTYYRYFTVNSPTELYTEISGVNAVCKASDDAVLLTAQPLSGGTPGATKTFYWQMSTNGTSFSKVTGSDQQLQIVVPKLTADVYYRVYAYENTACPFISDVHYIEALPTPIAVITNSASLLTGCYKYDLHNLPVYEKNGLTGYSVTLHYEDPGTDATDNSTLIDEEDYFVKKPRTIYARLSLGDICATSASAAIKIRKMEECYPISIPEFFSPDGDGINDLFQMSGLEEYDNPKIKVFDRYGKKVFEGGKEDLLSPNGWDGKYLNSDLPSGDYWYEMTFTELKPKVGHFSLKRRKE